jgi:serine protease AprX
MVHRWLLYYPLWNRTKSIRLFGLLLFSALLLPLLTVAPSFDAASPIQPALSRMIVQHPQSRLSVIVQKLSSDASLEERVDELGGVVTTNLALINAFAAELPAKAIPMLAANPNVRWISLNAPVNESSTTASFTTWATQHGTLDSGSVSADFNNTPIRAGSYLWLNSSLKVSGLGTKPVTIYLDNATIQYTVNGLLTSVSLPGAAVIFNPTTTKATTSFNATNNQWMTNVRTGTAGDIFLTGLAFQVPSDIPGGVKAIKWSSHFMSDTPGLTVSWKWAAAAYSQLGSNPSLFGIKPVSDSKASQYLNGDNAGTPENFKTAVIAGARGDGGSNYTGGYSASQSVTPWTQFTLADSLIDSPVGPNATFAYGSNVKAAFSGFTAEKTPGNSIAKVEVALPGYVLAQLRAGDDAKLTVSIDGLPDKSFDLNHHAFDTYIGASQMGTAYVDITSGHPWQWGDFDRDLELVIDQSQFHTDSYIYFDAVGLRVTSAPGVDTSGGLAPTKLPPGQINVDKLVNVYNRAVRATDVWNESPSYLQGQGVSVAVVDSGVFKNRDLNKRVIQNISINSAAHSSSDQYGHGTFVAGIVAGDGEDSHGARIGIAPKTNIINLRVSNEQEMPSEADVVSALQWIDENRTQYNIRVVNLSLNATEAQSYHTSPLAAACEMLWFHGVVVVVSAGNTGTADLYAPANDPFVITVGATDDRGTPELNDDIVADFSSYGVDESGSAKPDIVAPGKNIIGPLPNNDQLEISNDHPTNRVDKHYFRMSGTSMSAPIVSGAIALLLQNEPNLTPAQVKYRLKATATRAERWPGYDPNRAGAGYLDIYAAVHGTTTASANSGIPVSQLLWAQNTPVVWDTANWDVARWKITDWSVARWKSANWDVARWKTTDWKDYWDK